MNVYLPNNNFTVLWNFPGYSNVISDNSLEIYKLIPKCYQSICEIHKAVHVLFCLQAATSMRMLSSAVLWAIGCAHIELHATDVRTFHHKKPMFDNERF